MTITPVNSFAPPVIEIEQSKNHFLFGLSFFFIGLLVLLVVQDQLKNSHRKQ